VLSILACKTDDSAAFGIFAHVANVPVIGVGTFNPWLNTAATARVRERLGARSALETHHSALQWITTHVSDTGVGGVGTIDGPTNATTATFVGK
jgi:hypothetical protein